MRILVTNDDGIGSVGLRTVAKVLGKQHEVYVIAPVAQRSAAGHGISVHSPLAYEELEPDDGCRMRIAVDGMPADCVKLAVLHFMKDRLPDLVVSGINEGSNVGSDVIYSGTVSAALEGAYMGVRSIAVSNSDRTFLEGYALAAELVAGSLDEIMSFDMPDYTALNINYPGVRHRGIAVVPVGRNRYTDSFHEVRKGVLQIGGEPQDEETDTETDVSSVRRGFVTISPVTLDMNDYALLGKLREGFTL